MLYQKYRPVKFEEVLGQGETTNILKQQVINGNIAHTYLLEGNRGSGKTTSARILAKAINCENPIDGNPCGCCKSCKSISNGTNLDVIEIDAASNNGVDTVREIISNMQYAPDGRYKVYIIDEAHMLSKSAFNAFLKTLEEPPKYGIFILCTTEKNNLPITIISRCQQYKFKNIDSLVIENHLKSVARLENFQSTDLNKIANLIAIKADGAMRDALCLLEQVIDSNLSYTALVNLIGFTGDLEVKELALQSLKNNSINTLYNMGDIDVLNVVEGLVKTFRDIIVFRIAGPNAIKASLDELNVIENICDTFRQVSNSKINEIISLLSERYNDIFKSKFKFTLLEMTMISIETILNSENISEHINCPSVKEIQSNEVRNNKVIEEPIVQEPIVQEPIVQEPIVQEPIVQEPIVQEQVVDIYMISKAKHKMISMLEQVNNGKFDNLLMELKDAQFLKAVDLDKIIILADKVNAINENFKNPKMLAAMNQFFVFNNKQYYLVIG